MLAAITDEVDEGGARDDARVLRVQLSHDVAHVEGRCLQAHISQECMDGFWCQKTTFLSVNLRSTHLSCEYPKLIEVQNAPDTKLVIDTRCMAAREGLHAQT